MLRITFYTEIEIERTDVKQILNAKFSRRFFHSYLNLRQIFLFSFVSLRSYSFLSSSLTPLYVLSLHVLLFHFLLFPLHIFRLLPFSCSFWLHFTSLSFFSEVICSSLKNRFDPRGTSFFLRRSSSSLHAQMWTAWMSLSWILTVKIEMASFSTSRSGRFTICFDEDNLLCFFRLLIVVNKLVNSFSSRNQGIDINRQVRPRYQLDHYNKSQSFKNSLLDSS